MDSLVTIRKLKENGVECYFEKEGIFTFDGKSQASICRCLEKLGIKRNWTPIKIRIVSKLVSSYGRGRRTRTLNKGFGDPRVTITPCPYAVRPGLPERDLVYHFFGRLSSGFAKIVPNWQKIARCFTKPAAHGMMRAGKSA